ncbi:DUF1992 domain-containing protein [Yinghuangia sp. YIM S09857]|uniref:DnaJ family domain-containing protein n=1 Tax=Yinghuangia sp. YIM S09857 TaxID=3436929 RepID=UPI003F539B06
MTERKPPDVSFDSWVDRQIHEARERGDFDNLPGAGRPLAAADAPYDETWWLKEKLRGEGIAVLPPALRLRKEAEDALPAALRARSEREARTIIGEVNDKIVKHLRMPPPGPILNVKPFDVEEVAAAWRERHPDRVRSAPSRETHRPSAADAPSGSGADKAGRRERRPRWWRRRAG